MAFDGKNFGRGGYSNAPALFSYITTDDATTVGAAGYFNDKILDLKVGDFIFCLVDTANAPTPKIYCVTGNDGQNVTTTVVV